MSLKEKINEDLKAAMKAKDRTRLDTVRSIRTLILEFEKSGTGAELDNEAEIKMLTSAAKKRQEAMEQFRNAGRDDLADKEQAELEIIREYLPKQLTPDEILEAVKAIAIEVGAESKKDFAKVMPVAAKQLKGKADGKSIKEAVEKILS